MPEREFSRHTRADFSPAACIRTGRTEDLIDLGGLDIPGYGRVYLSTLEVATLAQMLGFIDGAASSAQLAQLREENVALRAQVKARTTVKTPPTVAKLERITRDLRSAVDDLAAFAIPSIGGDADIPVPAVESAAPAKRRTAPRVAVDASGDPASALLALAGIPVGSAGEQPAVVRENAPDMATGDSAPTGVDAEVDGPELDEGFGWLEQVARSDVDDVDLDPDNAGD